jgi:ribosomal protein S21
VVEFKRKRGESFESFLRRFNKTLLRSRKLNEVRRRKFMTAPRSKNKQKEYALISMKMRKQKEYLKKIGKLKEESRNKW